MSAPVPKGDPVHLWRPLEPEFRPYGPLTRTNFTFGDHVRIGEAVKALTYQGFPVSAHGRMPEKGEYSGHVSDDEVKQVVMDARQQPFTVTYRLEGTFHLKRPGTALLGVIGSGQVTVRPNGDYHLLTDRIRLIRQGDQIWRSTAGIWDGPYRADNVANDLPTTALAQLTSDQVGLLDVAYYSRFAGRKVLPDGTEEWYTGGLKQTTIAIFGSGLFSCYYYKLTVKPSREGYRLVAVDVDFWDGGSQGLHAEWNFALPGQIPLQRLEKLNLP